MSFEINKCDLTIFIDFSAITLKFDIKFGSMK